MLWVWSFSRIMVLNDISTNACPCVPTNPTITMNQPRCQLLNETKAKLLVIENRFRKLSWEHEVLEQRYAQSKSERDQMRDEYEKTIYNVKQKSGFDNQLIRKKISAVNNSLEQHDAQLLEVLKKTSPKILYQLIHSFAGDFLHAPSTPYT